MIKIVFSNVTIRPVPTSLGMFKPVLELMSAGLVNFTPLITHHYPFEQILEAMQDMKVKNEKRMKLLIDL